MRKGVAVGYVIALILGIVVITLIGVWFATTGGKFSSASTETICRTKAVEFCARFPSGTPTDWNTVRGDLVCDLLKLGIKATEDKPNCLIVQK